MPVGCAGISDGTASFVQHVFRFKVPHGSIGVHPLSQSTQPLVGVHTINHARTLLTAFEPSDVDVEAAVIQAKGVHLPQLELFW